MNTRKIKIKFFLPLVIIFLFGNLGFANLAFALPAFPGAEGMGATTAGGRGGTVYIVDTLLDTNNPNDGLTSFREAVTASGARIVTFKVSGIIELTSNLVIDDPYITIAGQTSPGGIAIVGSQTNINTHDVIVQHMRFRLGATRVVTQNQAESYGDAIEIGEYTTVIGNPPAQYNIIFDHCSFSWGIDETVSVACNSSDITISNSFITSGLSDSVHPESPHSAGFMAWGKYAVNQRVSLHHNFFGFNRFRNPENNYNSFIDSVNNVIYGFETTRTHEIGNQSGYSSTANLIGNYTKTSNSSSTPYARTAYIIEYNLNPANRVYAYGNLDGTRKSNSDEQWLVVQEYWNDVTASTNWRRNTPNATTGYFGDGIPVTPTVMSSSYASDIVANSGANKCQSGLCRDGVDTTAALHYENNTGTFTNGSEVDTINEISNLVNLSSPSSPTDSDNDGMPDSWEDDHGLNKSLNDSAVVNSDGYTNIEKYLYVLGGYADDEPSLPDTTPPSNPTGLSVE